MKIFSIVLVFLSIITFSACASGFKDNLPPGGTIMPGTDFVQQVATVVADSLAKTALQSTPVPDPVPSPLTIISTSQVIYLNPIIGIQFSYPDNWYVQEFTEGQPEAVIVTSFDPATPPHKLEWSDQTISMQIRLLPSSSISQDLEAWVESAKQTAVAVQLSLFEEERFLIANQPAARLTLVSGSGGTIHQILTILDGRNYEINIEGNLDLGKSVLSTLRAFSSNGLKPSEGDTPAAGICMEPQDGYVAIVLGQDQSGMPIAGRCIVLLTTQRIKLINQSDEPLAINLADYAINLSVGDEMLLDKPVGDYLAPGVHYLPMGPVLLVKTSGETPVASMPGPLQNYVNSEVGYTLTIPPGWNVDEYGLAMPNREVIFYPDNAEPFVVYLSISLDPRTQDQIINSYAQYALEAVRQDTIFNGQPAIKFTYPSGRHEYYIPYENRIYLIGTDKPLDGNVQLMLLSITFTQTAD